MSPLTGMNMGSEFGPRLAVGITNEKYSIKAKSLMGVLG